MHERKTIELHESRSEMEQITKFANMLNCLSFDSQEEGTLQEKEVM